MRRIESILPESYVRAESAEYKPINRRLGACIRELFPGTKNTPIPKLAEQALDILEPLVDYGKKHPLILRGSTVPRLINGTPSFYGAPSQLEWHLNKIDPHPSDLTKKAVAKLAKGPDMDWMYIKKAGVTDQDIYEMLHIWADKVNSRPNMKDFTISVDQVPLSDWNNEEDDRVYSILTFRKKGVDTRLLTIDSGQFPIEEQQRFDVRWSGYMTLRDMGAVADLVKKGKRHNAPWYVSIDKEYVSGWKHGYDRNYFTNGNDAQIVLSFLRSIVYKSVWPTQNTVKIGDITYYIPENFAEFIANKATKNSAYFDWDNFEHIGEGDLKLLEKRHEEIIAQSLLGLTLLGPEWLVVANEVGYLEHTPLGQKMRDTDLMDKLIERAWKRQNHHTEPDRDYIIEQMLRITQDEIQRWHMINNNENADETLKDTVSFAVLERFYKIFPYFSDIRNLPVKYRLGLVIPVLTRDYQTQLGYTALWPDMIDLYPVSLAYDLYDLGIIKKPTLSALVEELDILPVLRRRQQEMIESDDNYFDQQRFF